MFCTGLTRFRASGCDSAEVSSIQGPERFLWGCAIMCMYPL